MARRAAWLLVAAWLASPRSAEASGLGQLRPGTPIDLHLDLNAGPFPRRELRLAPVFGVGITPAWSGVMGLALDGDVRPIDRAPNLAFGAYGEAVIVNLGTPREDDQRGYQLRGGLSSRLSTTSGLGWVGLGAGTYVLRTHDVARVRRDDGPIGLDLALAVGGMLPSKRVGVGAELETRLGADVAGTSDLDPGLRAGVFLRLLMPSIGFGEVKD